MKNELMQTNLLLKWWNYLQLVWRRTQLCMVSERSQNTKNLCRSKQIHKLWSFKKPPQWKFFFFTFIPKSL